MFVNAYVPGSARDEEEREICWLKVVKCLQNMEVKVNIMLEILMVELGM